MCTEDRGFPAQRLAGWVGLGTSTVSWLDASGEFHQALECRWARSARLKESGVFPVTIHTCSSYVCFGASRAQPCPSDRTLTSHWRPECQGRAEQPCQVVSPKGNQATGTKGSFQKGKGFFRILCGAAGWGLRYCRSRAQRAEGGWGGKDRGEARGRCSGA